MYRWIWRYNCCTIPMGSFIILFLNRLHPVPSVWFLSNDPYMHDLLLGLCCIPTHSQISNVVSRVTIHSKWLMLSSQGQVNTIHQSQCSDKLTRVNLWTKGVSLSKNSYRFDTAFIITEEGLNNYWLGLWLTNSITKILFYSSIMSISKAFHAAWSPIMNHQLWRKTWAMEWIIFKSEKLENTLPCKL